MRKYVDWEDFREARITAWVPVEQLPELFGVSAGTIENWKKKDVRLSGRGEFSTCCQVI